MLSVGADTHRTDAYSGVHQGPISFVSSRQLSVQQRLSVPVHIDDLNEILGREEDMGEAIPAGQLQYRGLLGKDQPLAHRAQPNKS